MESDEMNDNFMNLSERDESSVSIEMMVDHKTKV